MFARILITAACLLILRSPVPCRAQEVEIVDYAVGFRGENGSVLQVGHWTPVYVDLAGDHEQVALELEVFDGDGVGAIYQEAGSERTSKRTIYAKFGRRTGSVVLRMIRRNDSEESAEEAKPEQVGAVSFLLEDVARCHESTREAILCLNSQERMNLDNLSRITSRPKHEAPFVQYVSDASHLPAEWYGYQSIDQIVVATSELGVLDEMTPEQRSALELWVRLGGRLTLSVGSRVDAIRGLSSMAELMPGEVERIVTQERAVGLEKYVVQTSEPLSPFRLALFRGTRGSVVVSEQSLTGEERPVIFRYPHGLGTVTAVATDLDVDPFREWESRDVLLAGLLRLKPGRRTGEDRRGQTLGQVTHIGYEDLAGQLRAILDRFEGPSGRSVVLSFSPIAACIAIYILLVAPGDYFLLKRLLGGRMEWTWITFPVLVVAACGLVYWASRTWKGESIAVKQIELVDYDESTSTVRGHAWASLYSPRTEAFNLDLRSEFEFSLKEGGGDAKEGDLFAWMGLPGRGLGGLDGSSPAAFFARPYGIMTRESRRAIREMPVVVASSKILEGVWWRTHVEGSETNLVRKRGYLTGDFTNPFPVELEAGVLYYNEWAYQLRGHVLPKQTVTLALDADDPRDLVWRLTRRRIQNENKQAGYLTTPWDPSGDDVGRLIEMLTFYEFAGGKAYVGLSHRYLDHLDLTEHLRHGRAVFVGRSRAEAASIQRDGTTLPAGQRTVYCRAVFPVSELAAP